MFLGHMAIGLAARRVEPRVSLATWFVAVQLVDLIWPVMLLLDLEHVAIAPGITAFTPLDFFDYPITHSLVGSLVWAALFAAFWFSIRANPWRKFPGAGGVALLLGAGVLSHWVLDVISHRPDVPLLPHGPYLGLGLWNSIPATLAVELTMFAAGLVIYLRSGFRRGAAGLLLAADCVSARRLLCRRVRSTSADCHDAGVVGACAVATRPVGALG